LVEGFLMLFPCLAAFCVHDEAASATVQLARRAVNTA
jgi:hypothetical protein